MHLVGAHRLGRLDEHILIVSVLALTHLERVLLGQVAHERVMDGEHVAEDHLHFHLRA